ncbi:FG-GAP repeat domain-containing protein [Shewanella waksmanii]|uniref:FG-GAP repeat domain-containing protein n=1 Tax=Shewanella waksmanii TaxID=213783 RepID=UPI00048F1440|nr:VCBS repeat-containing protein [Shewanella waksmanii]
MPLIKAKWHYLSGLLLASSAIFSAQAASNNAAVALDSYTIDVDFKLTHPILPLNLTQAPGKELVLFGVDDKQQRWLSVFEMDATEGYQQTFSIEVPYGFYGFDTTEDTSERSQQDLYFLSSDAVYKMVLAEGKVTFESLHDIAPITLKKRVEFITRSDFVRDLNKDGQDDFFIAGLQQSTLYMATTDGYDAIELPISPQVDHYSDGARYRAAKVYFVDLNLDGLDDIVKVGEGEFEYYPQLAGGQFRTIAQYVPVSLAISAIDWWNKRDAYGESLDQSDLIYRKVEQLKDINADGMADLVIRYTKSSGVLDRVNDYEIYLGENKAGLLSFPKQPSSVIKADGTLTGFELVDIDDDEVKEVMVAGFDIGLSQIIGALVSGSIDQDVHLFKMNASNAYADKANTSKEVELSFSLTSGQSGTPVVKLLDLNGDGLKDLLLSDGDDELRFYVGENSSKLFSSRSDKINIVLPQDGEMLSSADLNGDGKHDLMIKYGRQDDVELQSQFKVMLSN